jgi:hypothetical protein
MTNINKTPEKIRTRKRLFEIGVQSLQSQGWRVERIPGTGKSGVRRIVKGNDRRTIAIRTTQDQWFAFPRNAENDGWGTLSDVDDVVVVSVDNVINPRFGVVHFMRGKDILKRFDRAYKARMEAEHALDTGRGIWLALYEREKTKPVRLVGAGAGLDNKPIARVELWPEQKADEALKVQPDVQVGPLTIIEAKRGLALSLGIDPANIKILVEA